MSPDTGGMEVAPGNGYGNPYGGQPYGGNPYGNRGQQPGSQGAPPPYEGAPSQSAPPPNVEYENAPAPSAARGRIHFRVDPPDAAVYVDDRFAGTAEELSTLSRGLQIAPGSHRIVVSRPGFSTESTQVVVVEGQTESVEITLSKP